LLLPLYCLSVCRAMIRDEIQADTLRFLITRPITRLQFFVIKYLCHLVLVEGLAFLSGLLLLSVGVLRHIPDLGAFGLCFLGTQFLAVAAYGALSSLMGVVNQRYMVSIMLLLVATVGFLGLAAPLFAKREYHANEAMQK
jgi:ABC-type transport system involved in multi-copper enzyme maturation permease subunit